MQSESLKKIHRSVFEIFGKERRLEKLKKLRAIGLTKKISS